MTAATVTRTKRQDAAPARRRERGPYIGVWPDPEIYEQFEELRRRWNLSQTDTIKRAIRISHQVTSLTTSAG